MRILFVAMANSIHTARWINQLDGQGWDIHLFPSIDVGHAHPDLKNVTVYHTLYGRPRYRDKTVKLRGIPVISKYEAFIGREALKRIWPAYHMIYLREIIKKLRPDIIHSMEIQAGGYLTMAVKKEYKGEFPPWIVTNWGSDIYFYGRLANHVSRIKEVLGECDHYSCECFRDIHLARQMGLKGETLPVLPNTGGFDLARITRLQQPGPPSARRLILIKGYNDWAGRALVGLRAISLCANELQGYQIAVYLANRDVRRTAKSVSKSTGVPVKVIPYCSHDDMLRLFGCARVSIGLSISDAISTTLLEAMVMGAFPIQSCTACADEWIVDGKSGFIVPPEDPESIAAAIRRAVSEDTLIDQAAELNAKVARERLDQEIIKPKVIAIYEKVAAQSNMKRKRLRV